MPLTLDQVFIPACQQMLTSVSAVLKKAQAHAEAEGITEADMLGTRFTDDMWPLPNQIQGMYAHSAYAIEQVKGGAYRPNNRDVPTTWDELQAKIDLSLAGLDALEPGELDAIADTTMHFVIGDKPMFQFTVQNFLLSFSMPNVHFHGTTAYDQMRMRGVQLGKFDFLGRMRNDPMDQPAAM